MSLLLLYWGIMIACYAVASKLRHKKETFRFTEQLTNIVIYILVFLMGLRMGANEEVISNLGSIGLQAAGITVFVVGGSILAVHIARKALKLNKEGIFGLPEEEEQVGEEEREAESGGVKFTLIILTFVVAGMAAGYFMIPEIFEDTDAFQDMSGDWLVVGICILLALAGFYLGLEGKVIQSFKGVGIKVIFIPIAAVAGSLIMGAVYGLISSLTVSESIAVSAGFGWYTLAPGMLTEAGFAVAGAVSFMHNVIRETLGIVLIPIAAKKIGYLECTSIPGVAAMDVCLSIVERSCRAETVVYSFCTGALMCVCVPVVVTLAIG